MSKLSLVAFLIAASATAAFAQENHMSHAPTLTPQTSGTTQLLIAVSPVNSQVVWAAGTGGTYVLTTNGGETWTAGVVPGAESLQFRDVYGVSDKVAYLMSIGSNTTRRRRDMEDSIHKLARECVLRLFRVLDSDQGHRA